MNNIPLFIYSFDLDKYCIQSTIYQSEEFEEVQVGVEDVLYLLQLRLAEGTHGVAHPVEPHATGEDDEALQQSLAAGDVLQLQVWDTKGKLGSVETKGMLGLLWDMSQKSLFIITITS